MIISVIIPVYNERNVIGDCLKSLSQQSGEDFEIIVVDDGSTDSTFQVLSKFKVQSSHLPDGQAKFKVFKQEHKGAGAARNYGAKYAKGQILVFVDADMEFEPNFLDELVRPIIEGKAIGTFSKEEYLLNKENVWAKLWNLNLGRDQNKMHPKDYPDLQPVFRAILKSKFKQAGGFNENIGYTDDWSLSRQINTLAKVSRGAIFYHRNPEHLKEIWTQARWFGKNEFLTGSLIRKLYNLFRYCPVISLFKGFYGWSKWGYPQFLIFKIVYDSAIFVSVGLSFFGEKKYK